MAKFIKQTILSLITALCVVHTAVWPVLAQTAGLLFVSPQQYFDNNGRPLSGGKVYYYQPGTLTFKSIWSDANETTPLSNPVTLNAAGRPNGAVAIYGEGNYRQIIKDASGNQIADLVTSSGGSGGGTSATGDGDLVGTIKPWAGLIAPNQYAFAYGQELNRTTYSALYNAITQSLLITCTSGSPTLTNVSDTTQIRIGSALELSCVAPGTTVISKTAITVTLSANSSLSTSATAVFFPYGNGNGSTTFNLPDLRGYTVAGRDNMGGVAASRLTTAYFNPGGTSDPDALGAPGGAQSHALITAELAAHSHSSPAVTDPGHTHTITDPGHIHTITDPGHTHTITPTAATISGAYTSGATLNGAGTGATATQSNTTGISVNSHSTGITGANSNTTGITLASTTGTTGSGTAFSVVQPSITLNYIIKITPDTASSVATGVTSIQSMTGDIACGAGLTCTGNIISASGGGGGTPGGSNTQVQFNNSGSFGGSADLTWISPTLSIGSAGGVTGQLNLVGTTSGAVTIKSQAAAGTFNFNLPTTAGSANQPLLSGGGGATAMSWGTLSGNTTTFATTSGTLTSGNCAKFDASGNIVDNGSTCGGGGGSPGGSNTQVQFNNSGAFGGSADLTWVSPTLTIGVAGSATGVLKLTGSTSGTVTINSQSVAGTPTITWGTATGTPVVTASAPLSINTTTGNLTVTGAAGQVLAGSTPAFTATPTLGASGTLGSLTLGNATSGTLTLQTVTGALGTVTVSLPAATDTLVGKATTDTLTNKTIDTAGPNTIKIKGNTLSATAGTATVTIPNSTTTLTGKDTTDTLTNKTIDTAGPNTIKINGNTLSATAGTATVTVPNSTDTLVGKATTDTLTNKTIDTAGPNTIKINGNTLSATAGTATVTVPNSTDTLVGKATTDTLTNKTIDTAGPNTIKINGNTLSATAGTATITVPNATSTLASLGIEDQTLAGGANVTAKSQSTGNITVDCGARPLQYITNGGAYTITAPSNDGSCILFVTNNASAGATTFSGFSVGSNTGDALTTTNTSKFSIFIWRINSTSGYRIAAHQ